MIGLPCPPILTGVENCMVFTLARLVLVIPIMYINDHYFIDGFAPCGTAVRTWTR